MPLVVVVGQQDRRHLALEPLLAGKLDRLAGPYPVWVDQPAIAQDVPAAIRRAWHEAELCHRVKVARVGKELGPDAGSAVVDVTDERAVQACVAEVVGRFGRLDVLEHALGAMSEGGSIVVNSSAVGLTADPGIADYATAKHAQVGLIRVAAKEAGPPGRLPRLRRVRLHHGRHHRRRRRHEHLTGRLRARS